MTTEAVLILVLSTLILAGVYFGETGPVQTFKDAGPHLGARIERHMTTGVGFLGDNQRFPIDWQ